MNRHTRAIAVVAFAIVVSACSSDEPGDVSAPVTTIEAAPLRAPTLSTIAPPHLVAPDIARARAEIELDDRPLVERLPSLAGQTISILGPETDTAAESLLAAFAPFEELTGARIEYAGTADHVAVLADALGGDGAIPDIIVVAQPGRLRDLIARDNGARSIPRNVEAAVRANFDAFWSDLVQVEESLYGVPGKASVQSLVWYSPTVFAELNYEVPTSWSQLEELTNRMLFEGRTPWCVGIAAGDASGSVVTDWIEDLLLRRSGPAVYDQWVAHQIPANHPDVVEVVKEVGEIFHRPGNVLVDSGVEDIATIGLAEAGLPVLDGSCLLHRQGSSYGANYAETGAEFGTDIDVFYLPTVDDRFGQVVLGAGDYFVPMRTNAATTGFLIYVADPLFANTRAAASDGGFLSANRLQDTSLYRNPIDRQIADVLVQADPFRFDGSDLMPAFVGTGEMWQAGTSFAASAISAEEYLDRVEAAWSLAP